MEDNYKFHFFIFLSALLSAISCESQKQQLASPPGYDFSKPVKYKMPDALREISGIAFNKGNTDTLYAEEDEDGKVFHFKLGEEQLRMTRFGKKGDFEDIAISGNFIIMLRSDGVLFTFPVSETQKPDAQQVKIFERLLPAGEYEGLAADEQEGKIYVLCKHCNNQKTRKRGGGSIFQLDASGELTLTGDFEISIKDVDDLSKSGILNFHPSALGLNPATREWYIISSVNHILVITDQNWKVKSTYPLDPVLFNQPEGITFDHQQNLYISNERGQTSTGTVLLFPFQHK